MKINKKPQEYAVELNLFRSHSTRRRPASAAAGVCVAPVARLLKYFIVDSVNDVGGRRGRADLSMLFSYLKKEIAFLRTDEQQKNIYGRYEPIGALAQVARQEQTPDSSGGIRDGSVRTIRKDVSFELVFIVERTRSSRRLWALGTRNGRRSCSSERVCACGGRRTARFDLRVTQNATKVSTFPFFPRHRNFPKEILLRRCEEAPAAGRSHRRASLLCEDHEAAACSPRGDCNRRLRRLERSPSKSGGMHSPTRERNAISLLPDERCDIGSDIKQAVARRRPSRPARRRYPGSIYRAFTKRRSCNLVQSGLLVWTVQPHERRELL
ncbi:hypothetical protein EVAR_38538_1 [Eumeta japonica]|uniref:Uncharacterized protein n=1 Tax=Eumeta variegata TaxID=151549 RepID=A0A4C1WBX8_EUMVA|nr:hypothetical protein EVAR_38538_1 [Eumeta japonica]